jgi:pimeloyl-ACP methyl ester carboxylesterase
MTTTERVGVRRVGSGDHKVLALHGWFGSGGAWGAFEPHVDGATFEYAFPDYRGYGARKDEPGAHTLSEAAGDVLAVADSLGWERFSIVGHSMGGAVMQQVLLLAPDRVRRLVGISPVPASGAPFDDETWQVLTAAADDPGVRRAIVDLTTGNRLTATWLDAMTAHSVKESDRQAFADYLLAWAKTDFHEEIDGNRTPVKVIVGEHDPTIGADFMRQTFGSWYSDFELEILPSAGHYAMDEVPIALVTSVEAFLRAH